MKSPVQLTVTRVPSTATNNCGGGPCPATGTGGGWAGGAAAARTVPNVSPPMPARAASPIAGGVDGQLVGLLASMVLAVAARG